MIRLPVHVHDFLNSVRKATRELTDKNGKLPTDEDLSLHLETTVVKIQVRFCSRFWLFTCFTLRTRLIDDSWYLISPGFSMFVTPGMFTEFSAMIALPTRGCDHALVKVASLSFSTSTRICRIPTHLSPTLK